MGPSPYYYHHLDRNGSFREPYSGVIEVRSTAKTPEDYLTTLTPYYFTNYCTQNRDGVRSFRGHKKGSPLGAARTVCSGLRKPFRTEFAHPDRRHIAQRPRNKFHHGQHHFSSEKNDASRIFINEPRFEFKERCFLHSDLKHIEIHYTLPRVRLHP